MSSVAETLAVNIRRMRAQAGMTQEELADRSEVSARYIGSVERARVAVSVTVLERIANAFGVEAFELLRPQSIRD